MSETPKTSRVKGRERPQMLLSTPVHDKAPDSNNDNEESELVEAERHTEALTEELEAMQVR